MLRYEPGQDAIPLLCEGDYIFKITDEPEQRRTSKGKIYVVVKGVAEDVDGNKIRFQDVFFPWEDRFRDLLVACGAVANDDGLPHMREIEMLGKTFRASIRHEPRRDKPEQIMARITDINVPE